tara:strand:+ start:1878 stop:2480 length:603 start_codon:yes stop_codon:yes gene_type:complete
MALISSIAAGDISQRPEFTTGEQEWYDKKARPYAEALRSQALGEGGAAQRGARKSQGQLVAAQFGGQGGVLGERATTAMAPTFRRAMQRALMSAKQQADENTRRVMQERERKRAAGLSELGSVTNIESSLANLIPFAGPYIAGTTGLVGGLEQAAIGDSNKAGQTPLRTLDWGSPSTSTTDPSVRPGGGGLYDLYNLTYG